MRKVMDAGHETNTIVGADSVFRNDADARHNSPPIKAVTLARPAFFIPLMAQEKLPKEYFRRHGCFRRPLSPVRADDEITTISLQNKSKDTFNFREGADI
jgi:hypothetical protein